MLTLLIGLSICQPASPSDGAKHQPERSLIIGDSQAKGLQNARQLSRLGVDIYAFLGKPTEYFVSWLEAHPEVLMHKDLVMFQLGGNNITRGDSAERIMSDFERLTKLVKTYNRRARVVFGTIPVRGQWFDSHRFGSGKERELNRVNAWLEGEAHSFEVFPLNALVSDPRAPRQQRAEFRRKGSPDVHLNRKGYQAVAAAFAQVMLTR